MLGLCQAHVLAPASPMCGFERKPIGARCFGLFASVLFALLVACGSTDPNPPVGTNDSGGTGSGGTGNDGGSGGPGSDGGSSTDSGHPHDGGAGTDSGPAQDGSTEPLPNGEPAGEGACVGRTIHAVTNGHLLPRGWHFRGSQRFDRPPFDPSFNCPQVEGQFCGRDRINDVPLVYTTRPASSGPHFATVWAEWKAYERPLDARAYVHNLEHGGFAIFYRCDSADDCPDLAALVEGVVDAYPDETSINPETGELVCDPTDSRHARLRMLSAPDPNIGAPVVAVAWGWILETNCVNTTDIHNFFNFVRARGEPQEYECRHGRSEAWLRCFFGALNASEDPDCNGVN